MKTAKRKILILVLALCCAFSVLPLSSSAEEGELHYVGENGRDVKLTKWFHIEAKDVNDTGFKWNDNDYNQ